MILDSINKIWLLSKKNITLYIKKGPVLIFGLMFPFFMTLSWVIGREISLKLVFIGIISMTSFFTATAISPVILPIETREKSLERILNSPISLNEILLGIVLASTLYSLIITSVISIIFIILFSISFVSLSLILLMFLGIGLMAILGSLLALLISAYPTDMTSDVMILVNIIKFPLLFISGIFIPLNTLPPHLIFLAFISPITFLTDLLKFSVDGSNYFMFQFEFIILILWIVLLYSVGYFLHEKTMPKRFSETGKPKKKNEYEAEENGVENGEKKMSLNNLLSDIKFLTNKPVLKRIMKSKKFNIVRVCLEKGVEIEPHPELYAVFFLVLEGSGIFTSKLGEFILKKNDCLFIETNEIRGIKCLENLVILGVQDGH